MISTEHLRAEPYIYRTVPYILSSRTESPYPARKINRTVPYRGYVRLALDTTEREPNRIGGEMYSTVRCGAVRLAHSDHHLICSFEIITI